MHILRLLFFCLFPLFCSSQQSRLCVKLAELDEKGIEEFVWSTDHPKYGEDSYSKDLQDVSAIYLYYRNLYELKAIKSGQSVCYLVHRRVKILDKGIIDIFSELKSTDKEFKPTYKHYKSEFKRHLLGAKVIKSDKTEIVLKPENIVDQGANQVKIAVPGLEVGDILDYYSFFENNIPAKKDLMAVSSMFQFAGGMPTKHFETELRTDQNWKVTMTTRNCNLPIVEQQEGGQCYSFSIQDSNVSEIQKERWSYTFNSEPTAKISVKYKKDGLSERQAKGKPTLYIPGVDSQEILDYFRVRLKPLSKDGQYYKPFLKYLEKKGQLKEELSSLDLFEEYYYYLRHFRNSRFLTESYYLSPGLTNYLPAQRPMPEILYFLKQEKIPYQVFIFVPRDYGGLGDILSLGSADYLVKVVLDGKTHYFHEFNYNTGFGTLIKPADGAEAFLLTPKEDETFEVERTVIPVSPYEENSVHRTCEVHFNAEDSSILDCSMKVSFTGNQRELYKAWYMDWISVLEQEHEHYGTQRWSRVVRRKSKRKKMLFDAQFEDYEKAAKTKLKEALENYVKFFFSGETELITHKNPNSGNFIKDSTFTLELESQLKDFAWKIGDNYIIRAGALVGWKASMTVDEVAKERKTQVHFPYTTSYQGIVQIEVPEGYEAEPTALEQFQVDIKNPVGSLVSNAKMEEGKILIEYSAFYSNCVEPVENWKYVAELFGPKAGFQDKEILLRRE